MTALAEPQPAPTLKLTLNNPLFEAVPPKISEERPFGPAAKRLQLNAC